MESFLQRAFCSFRVSIFSVLALVVALGLSGGQTATAGLILASGDTNVVDPLTGAQGAIIDPGNQQFFANILQGGNSVAVLEATDFPTWNPHLVVNTFYNTIPGVTSTVISGMVTDAQLAGIDLFVSALPSDAFTAIEIASLDDFLTGGGSVFFLGEHNGFTAFNQRINEALATLGSSMSIIPASTFDPFVWTTAIGPQIASDPLTAGVTTFTYNTPSQVDGGTNLFLGTRGQPFVAFEETASVPEPPALLLIGISLVGLVAFAHRRKKIH